MNDYNSSEGSSRNNVLKSARVPWSLQSVNVFARN